MTDYEFSDSIVVEVGADQLYAMISDVTRTGEWSAQCRECRWVEGDGPAVGAWFTGRNEADGRSWETRSQVVAAEPGRRFAWEVNHGWVHWEFTLEPADGGTRLTESWEFLPAGLAGFRENYGESAEKQISKRTQFAMEGIPVTLAAIKRVAEGG